MFDKMTDEKQGTRKTRRGLLRDACALVGGAAVGAGIASDELREKVSFEHLKHALEDPSTDLLGVTVRAASPSSGDYGQYRGGAKKQGVFDSTLSPVGIETVEEYLSGKEMIQPPTTAEVDGEGWVLAQTEEEMHGINLETEETIQAPARGQTRIIEDDGYAYVADQGDLRKVEIQTGNTVDKIEGVLGAPATTTAPFAKNGDKAYTSISGATIEIDLNDLSYQELDDLRLGSSHIAIFDDGSKMVLNQSQQVKTYDLDNQEEIANLNNISPKGLSVFDDDETIAGVSGSKLYIWDEDLNRIDAVDQEGSTNTPPIPFTEDNGDKVVYNVDSLVDGIISAYELDSGSLNRKWEQETGVPTGSMILYGDTIVASSSEGARGINRENGEIEWSEGSFNTLVGMPYQEKIPMAGQDGVRILDAETDTIGDTQPELVHSWSGIPAEIRIDESTTWQHILEETGGESPVTGVEILYEVEAEDGEPFTVSAPLELDPDELMERDFGYSPISVDDGSFQGDYLEAENSVEVTHPIDMDGVEQREVTLRATPEDGSTSPERLL